MSGPPFRVLGIDPGSRSTGYGVLEISNRRAHYVASGCISAQQPELSQRLGTIFQEISQIISEFAPTTIAIESVFMAKNAASALKLGQARGVAIAAGVARDLPVFEYAARQVKQAVVGTGQANKEQVAHMVRVILGLPGAPQADAADALAIALCHVNTCQLVR